MGIDVVGFVIVATLLVLAPGQDTALVIRNATRGGTRAGIATTSGICSGLFGHATLSALGLSAIVATSAEAYATLKFAGAAYLIWLGVRSLTSTHVEEANAEDGSMASREAAEPWFRQGLLSNLLNPKTATFYLALLPQFAVVPDTVLRDSLFLAAVHFAISFVWLGFVAAAVDRAGRFIRRGSVRRWFDRVTGIVLVGFGARLALSSR